LPYPTMSRGYGTAFDFTRPFAFMESPPDDQRARRLPRT
jgi:hypothetical protein